MKTLLKIFTLFFCMLFLLISCNKENDKPIDDTDDIGCFVEKLIPITDRITSVTNSYIQSGDSLFFFNSVSGVYYHSATYNRNAFFLQFSTSLSFANLSPL